MSNNPRDEVEGIIQQYSPSLRRIIVFLQTKATHFETVMTTVEEVSSDETKVPDEFIFRSALLDCFTAELDE